MRYARMSASRLTAIMAGLLISLPISQITAAPPDSLPGASAHAVRLSTATFRPGLGERPAIPPGLSISEYAPGQRGYYIVQFSGPVRSEWKSDVEAHGAELLEYLPDFAFKTRMTPGQAKRVNAIDSVNWVGFYQPAFKLRPAMLAAEGEDLYRVRVHRGADAAAARSQARAAGASPTDGPGRVFLVRADAERLEAVARILEVGWIERFDLAELHNEYASGIIKADVANANGYDGSGQTVAIADTGLGTGTAAGAHPGISSGRVTIYDWVGADDPLCWDVIDDGPHDPSSGHGTHVAVSAVGAGNASGLGKGSAPGADLVFQAVENLAYFVGFCLGNPPGYILSGIPYDIRGLFEQAYGAGARVHSDSWGTQLNAGLYDIDSYYVDEFIWSNPDMTIAYSAGNASEDWNWDGYVNLADPVEGRYYVSTPATAKNLITVGASENDRQTHYECDPISTAYCDAETELNEVFTYGWAWNVQFGGPCPIACDPTAGNPEQMAGFSSRGPTHDNRLKPDVVAPGTWVLSGYSDLYQQYYDPAPDPQTGAWQSPGWFGPKDNEYKYAGGTSMATPIVAGGAAIVRQYYQVTAGHNASAALVKATLINSADDLLDENNDGSNDNDIPIPNNHEGWGRINLDSATDGGHVFEDVTPGLSTAGSANYQYTVDTAGSPFKVSLVWSDFPSSETAETNLVNDLDLTVVGPGGTIYKGNVFSGGWSQSGGSADRINNVENVYVQSAAAGSWSVTVTGYNVPQGTQPFALVVDGGEGDGSTADDPPSVSVTSPLDGATVGGTFDITANAGDDNGVDQVEFFVDGGSVGVDTDESDGWSVSWDSNSVADGGHTISATATDTISQTASDSVGVTVDNFVPPPGAKVHISDLDSTSADAGKGRWAATVTITVSLEGGGPASSAFVEGAWGGGATGGDSCTTSGSGTCQVSESVRNKFADASFTVNNVTHAGSTYDSGANKDPDGDSDGTTIVVPKDGGGTEPPPPPPTGPTMHIGDLDGSSQSAPRNRWEATVDVLVHDELEGPLADITVNGSWSTGSGGNCTTGGSGRCTITRSNIKGNNASTTFSVTGLTDSSATPTYVYDPAPNHDPDGDSDGSSIGINKP